MVLANSKVRSSGGLSDVCLSIELGGHSVEPILVDLAGKQIDLASGRRCCERYLAPLRTCCNGCNGRSAKARDFVDQKELFFEKDFSLLGDLADMQAVKRTK